MMSILHEPARVILGPRLNGTLMTPEEFDAVEEYDELYSYEIIRGVLVVNSLPAPEEIGPNEMLGYLLLSYREHHPQGSALDFTLPQQYMQTADSRRRADRVIWAGLGRQPVVRRDQPTIVVEFASADKRDRHRDYVEKRAEYLALGIAEYWVIDRFRRIVTVFRAGAAEQVVPRDGTYRTPLLPGFELPLARLFEVVDRIEDAGVTEAEA